MGRFVQLHMLTFYPPSNLNRDDLGRPKTAVVGGSTRLRISSQSLKRAWRTSDLFMRELDGNTGIRTKEIGVKVLEALKTGQPLSKVLSGMDTKTEKGIPEPKAKEWAWKIASVFVDKGKEVDSDGQQGEDETASKGKATKKKKSNVDKNTLKSEQLVFFSPEEIVAIDALISKIVAGATPGNADLQRLKIKPRTGADLAMFGRMMANSPNFNVEAAIQVAHAFTVHEVAVEDDFFTAVDDLNRGEEDMGAGHMGETEFASGLFYVYVCIDRDLLAKNLGGNEALAKKSLRALVESAAKVSPTGKQNSFASRAYAHYLLAEKGNQQPRTLAIAFLNGTGGRRGSNSHRDPVGALEAKRVNMEKVYGPCAEAYRTMNAETGEGSLDAILDFVSE